jgi:hypothetical protein
MFFFQADALHRLSATLEKCIHRPELCIGQDAVNELATSLELTEKLCIATDLKLSLNQVKHARQTLHAPGCNPEILVHILRELVSRMYEELQGETFLYIPKPKALFLKDEIWVDASIEENFPSSVPEFQRARWCYALDEATACVFHLMRVVDTGLKAAAFSLGIEYRTRGWGAVGECIQKKMEQKYGVKTDEWKQAEPFYAGVLTDIQAISKAHRNATIHEIGEIYDDREAHHLLLIVHGFIRHLSSAGLRESPT